MSVNLCCMRHTMVSTLAMQSVKVPWERAPRTAVAWDLPMVVQRLCCSVFVLNSPLELNNPSGWRGCKRKHSSCVRNSCCRWTMMVGPSSKGVADNLNDVIQMKCIYLNPVWCMMKQTNDIAEQSSVDHRVASREAFLLVPGQDQAIDTCTRIILSQGRLQAVQSDHVGSPNQVRVEVGP